MAPAQVEVGTKAIDPIIKILDAGTDDHDITQTAISMFTDVFSSAAVRPPPPCLLGPCAPGWRRLRCPPPPWTPGLFFFFFPVQPAAAAAAELRGPARYSNVAAPARRATTQGENAAADDVGVMLTEMFVKNPRECKNFEVLLRVLDEPAVPVRRATLKLLIMLLQNCPAKIQECFQAAPQGTSAIVDLLERGTHEVIRNEASLSAQHAF